MEDRGYRAGVVAGPRGEAVLRETKPPRAQPHCDHHPGALEVHVGDGDPRQVHQALECSPGAHGPGLLGLVDFAAPNLGTTRARHEDAVCAGLFAGPLEATGETGTDQGAAVGARTCCAMTRNGSSYRRDHPHSCRKTPIFFRSGDWSSRAGPSQPPGSCLRSCRCGSAARFLNGIGAHCDCVHPNGLPMNRTIRPPMREPTVNG